MSYPLCFILYLLHREGLCEKSKVKYIQHRKLACVAFMAAAAQETGGLDEAEKRVSLLSGSYLQMADRRDPPPHGQANTVLFLKSVRVRYCSSIQLTAKETENYVPGAGKRVHLYFIS